MKEVTIVLSVFVCKVRLVGREERACLDICVRSLQGWPARDTSASDRILYECTNRDTFVQLRTWRAVLTVDRLQIIHYILYETPVQQAIHIDHAFCGEQKWSSKGIL